MEENFHSDIKNNMDEWPKVVVQRQLELEDEEDSEKKHALQLKIDTFQSMIDELDDLEIHLPSITFEKKISIYGSKKMVELITFGGAHTKSDVILYIPSSKILHGGDILMNKFHPYLLDGDPTNWLELLDNLKTLDIEVIIPGHGDLGGIEIIEEMLNYFEALESIAKSDQLIEDIQGQYEDYLGGPDEFAKNVKFYRENLN